MPTGKNAYFASDFHLGAPNYEESLIRERRIVAWLNSIKANAHCLFLCGDIFDFWFEYKNVQPKGFSRLFGKLAEFTDAGIQLYVFPGNHDMWMLDFFKKEFSAKVYREPQQFTINGSTFYVSHGDGLGPGDYFYKGLKRVFESKITNFLFRYLLPADLGIYLGNSWATKSWKKHRELKDVYHFESPEKEILYSYSKELPFHNYFVFGHRHYKLDLEVAKGSRYINLGDWIYWFSYGEFNGETFELKISAK